MSKPSINTPEELLYVLEKVNGTLFNRQRTLYMCQHINFATPPAPAEPSWQRRFALLPLRTPDGWMWLKSYERRWTSSWKQFFSWEYRLGTLEWRNPSQWD